MNRPTLIIPSQIDISPMDNLEKDLRKIQRRDWQIWALVLTLFLVFSCFIVLVIFYSDLQALYEEQIDVYMFNLLLVGFVALSLLFIGYVMLKEMSIKKLQRDLMAQRISSQLLEQRLAELESVFEVTTLVNSEMVLSGVLDTISREALKTLGGDQSSLFLYDPQIGKLRCVSAWGPQSDLINQVEVETGKSVAGWVMQHGKPLHLGEDLKESQFADFIQKERKITSSLCVPLMVKNKAKGVLNISMFDNRKKFTETDLKLVSIFAQNAAISIDKAELYERLKKQTQTLKSTIDELKTAQDRLIQSEKLRALGNLASEMSNDFNNVLTAILSRTELFFKHVEEEAIPLHIRQSLSKSLKVIEQLAGDGTRVVERIQKFARTLKASSQKEFKKLDVNAIILEALEVTRPRWKDEAEQKGIRLEIQTELRELSHPVGTPSEIKDVLINIINNSIDALPDGGRIKITTGMRSEDHPSGREDMVEIKIMDNGMGMIDEIKSRVFDPFFTTKKEQGNGLGLSVAYGVISRHNGEIVVESEPGEGTTFTIILPVIGGKKMERAKETSVTSPVIL